MRGRGNDLWGKIMMNARWSDNDRYFGPFTLAKDKSYRPWGVMLQSADDDGSLPSIRLHLGAVTLISRLPGWLIRPRRVKVKAQYWSEHDIARMGRDWYWQVDEREFGFTFLGDGLHYRYGAQTNEWPGCKSGVIFYPWHEWRTVRETLFDAEGKVFADLPLLARGADNWEERHRLQDSCPTVRFSFLDYDGEQIDAITRIEEREQNWGVDRWKWLSVFRRSRVWRTLDIQFTSEVGKRKGSWKGGTVGHSIEMLPGEDHDAAFRRYCEEQGLAFVARASFAKPDGGRG